MGAKFTIVVVTKRRSIGASFCMYGALIQRIGKLHRLACFLMSMPFFKGKIVVR